MQRYSAVVLLIAATQAIKIGERQERSTEQGENRQVDLESLCDGDASCLDWAAEISSLREGLHEEKRAFLDIFSDDDAHATDFPGDEDSSDEEWTPEGPSTDEEWRTEGPSTDEDDTASTYGAELAQRGDGPQARDLTLVCEEEEEDDQEYYLEWENAKHEAEQFYLSVYGLAPPQDQEDGPSFMDLCDETVGNYYQCEAFKKFQHHFKELDGAEAEDYMDHGEAMFDYYNDELKCLDGAEYEDSSPEGEICWAVAEWGCYEDKEDLVYFVDCMTEGHKEHHQKYYSEYDGSDQYNLPDMSDESDHDDEESV